MCIRDSSWVPAHDDTWGSITVMVDETLFDLYPMHWAHLELSLIHISEPTRPY